MCSKIIVGIAGIMLAATRMSSGAPQVGPGATGGVDVKVTLDNGNIDGGTPTTSFDADNRQADESSVAISPVNSKVVAVVARDDRLIPISSLQFPGGPPCCTWVGVYVSSDGGTTWSNTFVPGFPTDVSPAGALSPLRGLDYGSDPVVRFDAAGDILVTGLAVDLNRSGNAQDGVVFFAKYAYTPGTRGTPGTANSPAQLPDFTYAFTTIIDSGAVQFLPPTATAVVATAKLDDKDWLAADTRPGSPCLGTIYSSFTRFAGGEVVIVLSRSTDGGASFSEPKPVSVSGKNGSVRAFGSNLAIGVDGAVYVSYATVGQSASNPASRVAFARSTDCGRHFDAPVTVTTYTEMPRFAEGLFFQTPTWTWVVADDSDPRVVYVAYTSLSGSPANADIFVVRSRTGGATWESPVRVNDDSTAKHQFFPAIAVSRGALHVAWYDLRDSPNSNDPAATNDVLNVYYAFSNTAGTTYPAFSRNVKITDVGFQPNCRVADFAPSIFGFMGDYIDIAATFNGTQHIVQIAWADNRDIPASQCDLDFAFSPDNNIGNRNQNVYTDRFFVDP